MIGQFIAEPGPASAMLLEEYLMLFDFHGQSLDDALRMFIEAFRLPVEAQQIDRVLQAFALQYWRNNPTLLANADVVHTLAFSLIMLNTDAHNDQIRSKMTLEQFISNNRGINRRRRRATPAAGGTVLHHQEARDQDERRRA